MSFLASIAGYVITSVLSALGGWLLKVFHLWVVDRQETSAKEAQTAAATKALQDAKTAGEIDDAAKSIADNFGK